MPSYATGPSRVSRGPVVGAYAEGDAMSRPCSHCGAAVDAFCVRPDGTLRFTPCATRLRGSHPDTNPTPPIAPRSAQTGAMTQGEQP